VIVECPDKARQPYSFSNLAVMILVFPDQQIGDSAWIVEITSHEPGWDDGHVLAVESRPRANKALMPTASLSSPLHRLIPVTVLSSEVPVSGSICKEGIQVCTPNPPPPADDAPLNLAVLQVVPYCARAEPQHFRRFA
jgi:hypothetical protein